MKRPLTRSAFAAMAMLAASALQTNAALIAYEGFDYDTGTTITGANGGTGWTTAWDTTGVTGLSRSGTGQSLWFDQDPVLITDGSTHVTSNANLGNRRAFPTVNLSSATLYFTVLIHVFGGPSVVDMRAEFWTNTDVTGFMRANVGISDGDLYVNVDSTGYKPAGSTVAAGVVSADTTYLLAMKRVGGNVAGVSGIYASLIPADGDVGDPSTLDSEPTWQVFQAGATGVAFQSIRFLANGTGGNIALDELRIATDWDSAVNGLVIPEPGSLMLLGLGGVSLLLRRRR